jgi:hypothetical protein
MNDTEFGEWLSTRFNEPEPHIDSSDVAERVLTRARNDRLARRGLLAGAALLGVGMWLAVTSGQTSLGLVAAGFSHALQALAAAVVPTTVVLCLVLTGLAAWRTASIR